MRLNKLSTTALSLVFGGTLATTSYAQAFDLGELQTDFSDDASAFEDEANDIADSLGATLDDPSFEAHRARKAKDGSTVRAKIKAECAKVNATEDQKKALMTSILGYKRDMIMLQAEAKVAMLDYLVSLANDTASRAGADSSGATLTAKATKIAERKVDFTNDVFFDVLMQDQRRAALKCLILIKKAHATIRHTHGDDHMLDLD